MTTLVTAPPWYAAGGVLKRHGHTDVDPGTPPPPPPPTGYDWTVNPYGTVYDVNDTTNGYYPSRATSGVPTGTTYTQTVTGSGGYYTISNAGTAKGTGTASAATDAITLAGHGLKNGHPVYFTTLTGGAGLTLGTGPVYIASNVTTDTFQVRRLQPANPADNTGGLVSGVVNITADYSAVTVYAGLWFDRVDFACHIKLSSTATGIVLRTRCRHRGPATAIDPASSSAALGTILNLSAAMVVGADCDYVPDAPVNKLDALYGKHYRELRPYWAHVIDGVGSHGDNEVYGYFLEKASWIYPDTVDGHSDGTHDDMVYQIFGNDRHVARGGRATGLIDAAASSTTDPTAHPIPATTNSDFQIVFKTGTVPTGLDIQGNLLGGGGYQVNIAGTQNYPDLGVVARNRHERNGKYAKTSAICAPAPNAKAGVVVRCDIPATGARANVWHDTGTPVTPYVAPGTSLVYP